MERKIDPRKVYATQVIKLLSKALEEALGLTQSVRYHVWSKRSKKLDKDLLDAAGLSWVNRGKAEVVIVYDNCHDNHDVLMTLVHELLHIRVHVLKLKEDPEESLVSNIEGMVSLLVNLYK